MNFVDSNGCFGLCTLNPASAKSRQDFNILSIGKPMFSHFILQYIFLELTILSGNVDETLK